MNNKEIWIKFATKTYMNEQELSNLIDLIVTETKPKIEEHTRNLKEINKHITYDIFEVMRMNEWEHLHSDFIADLLNPNGKHGLGTLFLEKFLKKINLNNIDNLQNADVSIEHICGNRRIDILIEINQVKIGIENKIYASLGENQLEDYLTYLKENNGYLVYLSLHGNTTDIKEEVLEHKKFFVLSYYKDISEIINEILKQNNLNETQKNILASYNKLIIKLTKMGTHEIVKIVHDILINKLESKYLDLQEVHALIGTFNDYNRGCSKLFFKKLLEEISNIENIKIEDSDNTDTILTFSYNNSNYYISLIYDYNYGDYDAEIGNNKNSARFNKIKDNCWNNISWFDIFDYTIGITNGTINNKVNKIKEAIKTFINEGCNQN